VQDQPDEAALSMGNSSNGLIMSQARDHSSINYFKDTAFGPGSGIRNLI
jgi:hypothetical protein